MADFHQAHKFVERWEGFYSNDPDDPGGETLYGISRVHHPEWNGWALWDREQKETPTLLECRDSFYQAKFWGPLNLQKFPSRRLAIIVYQAAINCGVRRVSRWLQVVLNDLLGSKLVVDGHIGEQTVKTVRNAFERGFIRVVEDNMLLKQRLYYEHRADDDPRMQKYLKGWLNRVRAAEAL